MKNIFKKQKYRYSNIDYDKMILTKETYIEDGIEYTFLEVIKIKFFKRHYIIKNKMTEKRKHDLITAIVALIMVFVAVCFTDGTIDNWKDYFMALYPATIFWIYFRLAGFLRFKR